MEDETKETIEMEIRSDFTAIAREISAYLDAEHDRLLELGSKLVKSGSEVKYMRTDAFSECFKNLVELSVGKFEVECDGQKAGRKRDAPQPSMDLAAMKKPRARSIYEEMKLLATVKLEKPSAITLMPHENCFAVRHLHNISFVSLTGKVLSSHSLRASKWETLPPPRFCPMALTLNPMNERQLIGTDRGLIASFEPIIFPMNYDFVISCKRIQAQFAPFGLGVSGNVLFTSFGKSISSYSLTDWSPKASFFVDGLVKNTRGPMILGARNNLLLFRDDFATASLCMVPIDVNGELVMDQKKEIPPKFSDFAAVELDENGNILVAGKDCSSIKILSPDGSEMLASICLPSSPGRFPALAIWTVPEGGKLAEFDGVQCSRVLAVSNWPADEVLFFGIAHHKNAG